MEGNRFEVEDLAEHIGEAFKAEVFLRIDVVPRVQMLLNKPSLRVGAINGGPCELHTRLPECGQWRLLDGRDIEAHAPSGFDVSVIQLPCAKHLICRIECILQKVQILHESLHNGYCAETLRCSAAHGELAQLPG